MPNAVVTRPGTAYEGVTGGSRVWRSCRGIGHCVVGLGDERLMKGGDKIWQRIWYGEGRGL